MGAWHTAIMEEGSVVALREECIRQHDAKAFADAEIKRLRAEVERLTREERTAWESREFWFKAAEAELVRAETAEAERDRLREALTGRPMNEAPRDGTCFLLTTTCRWVPYKKGAPADLLRRGGRFQIFDGYGWKNLDDPTNSERTWLPALSPATGEGS